MEEAKQPQRISLRTSFRRNFVTGLLVLAPLWLTGYIIFVVVRLIGGLLSPYFRKVFEMAIADGGKWTLGIRFVADVSAFVVTILAIAVIGFIVRRVIGRKLVEIVNRIVGRIPVIREIYESLRKFIDIFFGDKTKFKRVVAVRFPTDSCWSLAFVTGELKLGSVEDPLASHLTLFIPTAPIPTSGFLVMAQEKDVISLLITVDEALKVLISGGTLTPERIAVMR